MIHVRACGSPVVAHFHADAGVLTGEGTDIRANSGVTTETVGQDEGFLSPPGSAHHVLAGSPGAIVEQLPGSQFLDSEQYFGCADRSAFARVATLMPLKCAGRHCRNPAVGSAGCLGIGRVRRKVSSVIALPIVQSHKQQGVVALPPACNSTALERDVRRDAVLAMRPLARSG